MMKGPFDAENWKVHLALTSVQVGKILTLLEFEQG
jgi:hypothetical protein